jgi:acyl-coenzyme A thioesterase PaaI-like protein
VADGVSTGPRVSAGQDADGFTSYFFEGPGFHRIYGEVKARAEGERMARVRTQVGPEHANPIMTLHGGFLLAFLDEALFVGTVQLGLVTFAGSVTVSLSSNFVSGGVIDRPLDCVVEVSGETRRMLFLRGTMEQGNHTVLTFQATVRKLSPNPV